MYGVISSQSLAKKNKKRYYTKASKYFARQSRRWFLALTLRICLFFFSTKKFCYRSICFNSYGFNDIVHTTLIVNEIPKTSFLNYYSTCAYVNKHCVGFLNLKVGCAWYTRRELTFSLVTVDCRERYFFFEFWV